MVLVRMDDFDGSPAEETTFGLFGVAYVLDAGVATREAMTRALQPFLTVAADYGKLPSTAGRAQPSTSPSLTTSASISASVSTRTRRRAHVAQSAGKVPHSTIRVWARAQGYPVDRKGRIPDRVIEAYDQAHGLKKP